MNAQVEQLKMISGQNFIVIGIQDWEDDPNFNSKNLSLEFSNENRVCYIHTPIFRSLYFKKSKSTTELKRLEIVKQRRTAIKKITEKLHIAYPHHFNESINWIRLNWLFDKLNHRNSKNFASQIKQIAQSIGFDDYIMIIDNEFIQSQYLKQILNPKLFVYYIRDYFTAVEYWKYHGTRLEPSIIHKSDIVLSNSQFLQNYAKKYNANAIYIGQGCRLDIFNDHVDSLKKPDDLESIPKPIIGFFGHLTSLRLDIKLISKISKKFPQCSIVLVGSEDADFKQCALHDVSNIYFLGSKPYNLLPSYLSHFDICINPQIRNEITEGNYPLKIDEYLAAGKQVVTLHTNAMDIFRGHVRLAKNSDSFVDEIRKGLNHKDDQEEIKKRIEVAKSHSWKNVTEKIYDAIDNKMIND